MSADRLAVPAYPSYVYDDGYEYATDEPEDESEPERGAWTPVDMEPLLSGTYVAPVPTVGGRADGLGAFYLGRTHAVISETEAGKTTLALHGIGVELARGNAAAMVDFEDDEAGVVGRLLGSGVSPDVLRERFAYLRPSEPITALGNATDLGQVIGDLKPTFVVLDGVTEGMTLHGLNPIDNADVAKFGRLVAGPIARAGPAVTSLDHVTKSREGRGRYPIGAVHKLNGLTGAAYTLESRKPFGIGLTGRSSVFIVKDRPGQLRARSLPAGEGLYWYGDLVVESLEGGAYTNISVVAPVATTESFRPTTLMRRVSDALHGAPSPLSTRDIGDRVKGNAQAIRTATAVLVDEGYVAVDVKGTAHLHRLVKPFTEQGASPCPVS